jgi:TatD DNase family protein
MRLVDAHAHLQVDAFRADAPAVAAAARQAGVVRMLVPGVDAETSMAAIELARTIGDLDVSAGIHPHVASSADDAIWARIEELAHDPRVVAIGETGLDYDRVFSPQDAQLANLRRHLSLATRVGKPLILHCRSRRGERDAQDDLLHELDAAGGPRAVLHSFSGPVDYAERALELGCAVSFSGLVFRSTEGASAQVARLVPADRLLVETDSPYLSPPGAPRRRNEPRWVEVTARWLAEQRHEEPEALGEAVVASYDRVFGVRRSGSTPGAHELDTNVIG